MDKSRLVLQEPQVLVLAGGKNAGEVATNQGHLFEVFVGRLLENLGYAAPTSSSLNTTSEGIEIDVRSSHTTTKQSIIAECKAYSRALPVNVLTSFYGVLGADRLVDPEVFGLLVALPRLTADGAEKAASIEAKDRKFRYMNAQNVATLLDERRIIRPPLNNKNYSDHAILISPEGVYCAAKELDPQTRTPALIRAWGVDGEVPTPVLKLLENHSYAEGLDVAPEIGVSMASLNSAGSEIAVSLVQGASSDFEYQYPASPAFFVGREAILSTFKEILRVKRPRSVVLNAQSGWGKSSLALRINQMVVDMGGHGLVVDTRAVMPGFVVASLRRGLIEAEKKGLCTLPTDAAFSSVASCLRAMRGARWKKGSLLLFFDQFENAFRHREVTTEFAALAVGLAELSHPIVVGFAWKTDLVGWTEDHPYDLRDAIRGVSQVIQVPTFDAKEIGQLIARLEQVLGTSLRKELQDRLREYSQGLPWLFKKLAAHIARELHAGRSQEQLLAESLNVDGLFRADLAELSPEEHEGLLFVARNAPLTATEAIGTVNAPIIQSLLNRRLLVQVGERLDTYWDIFRDFLTTGRVDIKDSFILRMNPKQTARLASLLASSDGFVSVPDAALVLKTTETVIFNVTRELRLLGLVRQEPNRVALVESLRAAADPEAAMVMRVADTLRRHRMLDALRSIPMSDVDDRAEALAASLPSAFPAVDAKPSTWKIYAAAFVKWCEYGQLIPISTPAADLRLLQRGVVNRVAGSFPQKPPGPCLDVLRHIQRGAGPVPSNSRTRTAAVRELVSLGAVEKSSNGQLRIVVPGLVNEDGAVDRSILRSLLGSTPGGARALDLLERHPDSSPAAVGGVLATGHGVEWALNTRTSAGKHFRGWARLAGIETKARRSSGKSSES